MDFPNGPWKKVLSGIYDDYELSIQLNQDGFVITEILNPEKTKNILSLSLAFGVFGDAETFVETLPRNATYFLLHGTQADSKFLLLSNDSEVLNDDQKEITDFVNTQFKKLQKETKSIVDIAGSYDIKLKKYSDLPQELKGMLFRNPIYMLGVLPTKTPRVTQIVTKSSPASNTKQQEMFLGFFKTTNEKCVESLDLFKRTLVFGNSSSKNFLTVLLEELSLCRMNSLVFAYDSSAANIKFPNSSEKNVQELTGSTPMGFPLLSFNAEEKIFVNISDLSEGVFSEQHKINDKIISELISKVIVEKQPGTIEDLIKFVSEQQPSESLTAYNISLAARILQIVKMQFPNLYSGDFVVSDFFKDLGKNMGHANLVILNKNNALANREIIFNVLKKVSNLAQSNPPIAIIIPNAKEILGRDAVDLLTKSTVDLINADRENSYFFFTFNETDLDKSLFEKSTAKLSILEENDVGLALKDSKPYRLVLRPTLSKV